VGGNNHREGKLEPAEETLLVEVACPRCRSVVEGDPHGGMVCESCGFVFSLEKGGEETLSGD